MRATTRGAQSNRVLSAILAFVLAFGCCGGGYYFGSGTEAAYAESTPSITSPVNNEAKTVAQNGTLNINISASPQEPLTDHLTWQWEVRDANDNDSVWAPVSGSGNGTGAVGETVTEKTSYTVPTAKAGVFEYRCFVKEYYGTSNYDYRGEARSNIFTVTVQAAQETTLPEGPSIVTQPTGVNYDQNLDGLDGRETIVLEQPLATSDVNGKFSKMEITVKQPYNVGGVITFKKENAKIYLVQNGGEAEIPASDVAVQNDDNGNIKFVFFDQYLNRSANGLPYNGAKVRMKLVGFVSNDMNTLRQYRTGDGSGATDDASIPYTIEAETVVSTKADHSLQNPYTMTPSQKNLVVSMPKLALTKTEIDGNTNTNFGSERQYRVTLTNQNANVPAKHLVITDNPERNYGLDIATSDVVVDKRTATGTVEHYSDAVVTKDGNGFKVDFGANSSLAGNEAYIVTYKMVSSSTEYFNALRQASKFTNTTKASADNAFAEASADLAMNILIPTASASATMPARTVLTTSEGGQVTVNFYMDGTEGVELINPTFTIGQTDTTGTATIENAQLTVRGQQGTYDMSSGSRKVEARIARPANPTSEPVATLTYTVKAPADSTGNNGNVTVTTSMTAENLLNAATTTASFTIAVPTANIRATVNNATPSASSEAEGVPATKVGVTVDAWQVADYAEIQEPLISIIDKAVDSSRNPVADKFANLTVRYDGAILPVTVYPSEGEFNAALPALKNTATAAAFIDRSTDTLKIASGKYIAKDKHLVLTYDDEMVKGSAANTGEEALSATIDNYSSTGNLPRSAHSETKYTMQDPSLYVGEVVTEPSDEMPIINFGDSAKFRTTFNTNNAAEYRNAQAKDFTLTINIDDILIGTKTYTPMEAGVSFVRKATIKDGDTDVSSQYKLEWGTDGASLTITAQDPAKILPYSAITVDYEVATSATGLHSDQIRGADISVTSRLTASNARADATSPSASVKIADAALGIKKKVAHQLIKKGDTDKYTITVSNVYAGSYSKARGVTVTDELDASAVKFGYAMDKSSLKVTLGGTDITSQTSVKWTKSKKFVLTVNQELAKGSDLVITYNGTTKGISSGSYSQDLTNVAVAEAYNAKPVVAMRTVTYNGAVAEDEVPSTNGNVIVNPTPSTPSGQMGEIGTGENGAGSSPLGGGGAAAGNNGDNGSATDGNNGGNGSATAGDNNATAGSGANGTTANGSNASGTASDSAKAPAASQTASNTANSKSGSPSGMQSTGDELPITAGVILIIALVAAGSVAIVRRKRS